MTGRMSRKERMALALQRRMEAEKKNGAGVSAGEPAVEQKPMPAESAAGGKAERAKSRADRFAKAMGRKIGAAQQPVVEAKEVAQQPVVEAKEEYDWPAEQRKASVIEDTNERDKAYSKVAVNILKHNREIYPAYAVAGYIENRYLKAKVLVNIATVYIDQGTGDSAKVAKDRLEEALYNAEQLAPDSVHTISLMANIAFEYSKLGDKQKAEKLFDEILSLVPKMKEEGRYTRENVRETVEKLMGEYEIKSREDEKTKDEMPKDEAQETYEDFGTGYEEESEEPEVMNAVEELIEEAKSEEKEDRISELLDGAYAEAKKVKDPYDRAVELVRVADAYLELLKEGKNLAGSTYEEALKVLDEMEDEILRSEAKNVLKKHMKEMGIKPKIRVPPPPKTGYQTPVPGQAQAAEPKVVVAPDEEASDEDAVTEVWEGAATQIYEFTEDEETQIYEEATQKYDEIKEKKEDPVRRLLIENMAMIKAIRILMQKTDPGALGTIVNEQLNETAGEVIETKFKNARIDDLKAVHELRQEINRLKGMVEKNLLFEHAMVTTQLVNALLQNDYLGRMVKLEEAYGTAALETALMGIIGMGAKGLRKQYPLDKIRANRVLEKAVEVMNIYKEGDE